ncbi:MAG: hypothetical protein PHV05_01565 [Candidatus Riflebacteria bacterium]|nr:hypothetical protein [Candidatus Riflebacteria bacterium]
MKIRPTILFLALMPLALPLMASSDIDELIKNMPSPDVNYPTHEVKLIKLTEPAALPIKQVKPDLKKFKKHLETLAEIPPVQTMKKIIRSFTQKSKKTNGKSLINSEKVIQPPQAASTTEALRVSTIPKAVRPPPIPKNTHTKVIASTRTLLQNPALAEQKNNLTKDLQLIKDIFALYLSETEKRDETTSSTAVVMSQTSENENAPEETPQPLPAGYDSVMVKANSLYNKGNWKDLKNLFAENTEMAETAEGLRYIIEAELHLEKLDYMAIRRYSAKLAENDQNNPIANYGLATYFYYSKKPDFKKAAKALEIALKAEVVPDGATKLYWKLLFKNYGVPFMALAAILIAGVAHLIKKKKLAQSIIDLEPASETDANSSLSAFKARLMSMLKKSSVKSDNAPMATKEQMVEYEEVDEEIEVEIEVDEDEDKNEKTKH